MKLSDLIAVSFRNLWRRKLRTFLTVLGVIIGTSSIVIMLSLGLAMNKNMMDQLDSMGSINIINVSKRWGYDDSGQESKKLTDDAIEKMGAIPGVEIASPVVELNVKFGSGRYYAWANVRAVSAQMLEAQDIKLDWGQMPDSSDRYGFVFGSNIAYNFYNPNSRNSYGGYWYGEDGERPEPDVDVQNDPIKMSYDMSYGEQRMPGQKQARPIPITVTGVVEEGSGEHDYMVYTTFETAKKMIQEKEKWEKSQNPDSGRDKGEDEGYESALIYVTDIDDVKEIQDRIKEMGYEAWSMVDYLEEIQNISGGIQMVLGGIGAVSLFVAALGITNTMIMSIYERTKEIGVMKVIGASLPDIKKMFLTEAAMIGFLGGVLGLLFSAGVSMILNYVGQNVNMFGGPGTAGTTLSVIPFWLYAASILFTSMVGLTSGYFPARRAMKLSVLGALRNE